MWKDKISVRVHTRFRKLRADHSVPLLQKCRRAREILEEIYADRELCITENLIRRAAWLGGFHPWRPDEFYTSAFESEIIQRRLEAMIGSPEAQEPQDPALPACADPAQSPDPLPEGECAEPEEAAETIPLETAAEA